MLMEEPGCALEVCNLERGISLSVRNDAALYANSMKKPELEASHD